MKFTKPTYDRQKTKEDVEAFKEDIDKMTACVSGRCLDKLSDSKGRNRYKIEFEATLRHGLFLETAKAAAYSDDPDVLAELADGIQASCKPSDLSQNTAVRFYSADGKALYGALIGFVRESEWSGLNGFERKGRIEFDFSDPYPIPIEA